MTIAELIGKDFKHVLQDFTICYLIERPKDIVEFGLRYFNDLRTKRVTSYIESSTDMMDGDVDFVPPTVVGPGRRHTVFEASVNPERESMSVREIHPKNVEQREKLLATVKSILLFNSLDPDNLDEIIDAMREKLVTQGESIIEQGEDGDYFYVVEDGVYEALVRDPVGEETVVKTYNNEGYFGELALLYNTPRAATVVAKTNGKLWMMSRETFRKSVVQNAYKKRKAYDDFLAKVPILSELKPGERLNVADALNSMTFAMDECIVKQGARADGMYFIESGTVRVAIKGPAGVDVTIKMLGPGDYFGELALLTKRRRVASVYAASPVRVAFLGVEPFERLLGSCMIIMKRNAKKYEEQLSHVIGGSVNLNDLKDEI